jgi:Kef-type K+ transport system membrane component KefB
MPDATLLLAAVLAILLLIAVAMIAMTGLVTIVSRYFRRSDPLRRSRHALGSGLSINKGQ